ncbi:cell wall metabolism sensor histidine kinase WalK [Formosa sp. L2A11]|uniref:sensor histidine kinase n=1 Tax=Formosa sp. L2A11 TaxID=2686363 RepID=UPI00131D641F|nr:HAMP domain-containing sensor histidine kinase [Formosa sp. L2A11]
MKLLNQSLIYLSTTFLVIIGAWSIIFYINIKDEIRDSIDDGLENNKLLIIQKSRVDSTLLSQHEFGGNNFEIHPISKQNTSFKKDVYKDTLMYRHNEDDLEPVRILHSVFKHQNTYYHLKIISSLIEEDDLIEDASYSVFWLFVILISSIFIINNIVLRKIWHPFYSILNRLKHYKLNALESPINVNTKTKEFIQLQDASNTLIHHTKKVFTAQKQFTENASHELQTPIAIITNKLELLLESKHLNADDAKIIAEVINMTDRLKKLNKTLLLLTKIENKQFLQQEKVSINTIIKDIAKEYTEYAEFKNIEIKIEDVGHLEVEMNRSLAETLISNLIKNAIFHNIERGKITVFVSRHTFSIINTGPSESLDSKTIFNRFTKDDSKTQSTGLGLAVCQAICDLYNYNLSYQYIQNEHHFSINFKN